MPFLTERENKECQNIPFINKFSVESFYDFKRGIDFEIISRAKECDLECDGYNFAGISDAYNFDLYDTLEDALNHHHKRIDLVSFENLSDDEMQIVNTFVKEKMEDEEYLSKYRISK